jgi:hypothetical protein
MPGRRHAGPTSSCDTGYFGELLVCSPAARDVLDLDIYAMREKRAPKGVVYRPAKARD